MYIYNSDCTYVCAAAAHCSGEGEVRLVGGSGPHEGRVEVYHNDTWGTVCDDDWDLQDAAVTCRQLGYGRAVAAVRNAAYGGGSGPIWLDDVHCNGSEASLTQCTHRGLGVHYCAHSRDVGVICTSESHSSWYHQLNGRKHTVYRVSCYGKDTY